MEVSCSTTLQLKAGNSKLVKCEKHPDYTGSKKPRTKCEKCKEIWETAELLKIPDFLKRKP